MGRHYRRLTAGDRAVLWTRWQRGETLLAISEALGTFKSNVWSEVHRRGGLVPAPRHRAPRVLQSAEREEISRGLAAGESLRRIAHRVGRAPSTISREIRRHGGARRYRASAADAAAWAHARRPKRCRLVQDRQLCQLVASGLRRDWSPEQIARWLRVSFPDEPARYVSPETIYRTLYVQARGALQRELLAPLRHGQRYRRPRAAARPPRGQGQLRDTVSIAERPPAADTRAVPGHWEGDLLIGQRGTQIATLVERQSRFVLLARLAAADSATVVDALARHITRVPSVLQRSLTWDRGKEMAQHQRFTVATGVQVYFCDPHSPWPRGSNENTNGLLRQYFPKGTDVRGVTQRQLDAVALTLNTRPRKTLDWHTPAAVLAVTVASTG